MRLTLFSLLLINLLAIPVGADEIEPPRNPFLADSPWPITHANSYAQGSSSLPGLQQSDRVQFDYLKSDPVAITLVYGPLDQNGKRAIWSNTVKHIYKIDANGKKWCYADRQDRRQSIQDGMSGAYSLIDKDGVFFVPRSGKIEAYSDECRNDSLSGIVKIGEFVLPACTMRSADELIVGMNMTYDGWIALVTDHGMVGVISRDFQQSHFLHVNGGEGVSNSLSVDEDGGIYITTSKRVYRVQWDGAHLQTLWSVAYKTIDQTITGRLGAGSGTTPTLMGVAGQDKFIVIGDGQELMHLVLIWRDQVPADWTPLPGCDPRIAAEVPVTFGDCHARKSSTEQSVLVSGYSAVVVSNLYGQVRIRPRSRNITDKVRIAVSNQKKVAPHGVEKFTWNPLTRQLERTWANPCVSCPNAIPSMSRATQLMYCIGARDEAWTLEALDWNTGESVFYVPLRHKLKFNSFYAGTQIGPNGDIVSGCDWSYENQENHKVCRVDELTIGSLQAYEVNAC